MFQTTSTATFPGNAARTAEQGDARMALQRREDDQRRRSGGKRRDSHTLSNDEASVSVEALQVFLTNLLRANETRQERDIAMNAADNAQSARPGHKAVDTANFASPSARAARAYANASRTARLNPPMETALITQENPLAGANKPRLSGQEKQQIEAIQENLAALVSLGVRDITIERGDTFLGSLATSVESALGDARGD